MLAYRDCGKERGMKIVFGVFIAWGFFWAGKTIGSGGEEWQLVLHLFCGGVNLLALCFIGD